MKGLPSRSCHDRICLGDVVADIASRISTGKLLWDPYHTGESSSQRRLGGGLYAHTLDAYGVSLIPLKYGASYDMQTCTLMTK